MIFVMGVNLFLLLFIFMSFFETGCNNFLVKRLQPILHDLPETVSYGIFTPYIKKVLCFVAQIHGHLGSS